jgi:hypothetical protein
MQIAGQEIRISASFDPSSVRLDTVQSTRLVVGPTSLCHHLSGNSPVSGHRAHRNFWSLQPNRDLTPPTPCSSELTWRADVKHLKEFSRLGEHRAKPRGSKESSSLRNGISARFVPHPGSFANGLDAATCYVETLTSRSALPESGPSRSQSGPSIDFDFRPSGP